MARTPGGFRAAAVLELEYRDLCSDRAGLQGGAARQGTRSFQSGLEERRRAAVERRGERRATPGPRPELVSLRKDFKSRVQPGPGKAVADRSAERAQQPGRPGGGGRGSGEQA